MSEFKQYATYEIQQFGKTLEWTDHIGAAESVWRGLTPCGGSAVFYKKVGSRKFVLKRK